MVIIRSRLIALSLVLLTAAIVLGSCSGGGGSAGVAPGPIVPAPAAPTTVYAVVSGQTATGVSVTVHWSSMPYATSYSVLRSDTSPTDPSTFLVKATGLSTLYTDTSVTIGTHYYAVKSVGNSGVSGLSAAAKAVVQTVAIGTASISGTIQYEDKKYDIFGFTGAKPLKAVRYAMVDLMSAPSPTPLATTVTSPSGTFMFNIAPADIGKNVYVSVEADAVSPAGEVAVKHMDTTLYAAKSASLNVMDGTAADLSLSIPVSHPAGGAFNIIDVYTSSAQFVNSLSLKTVPTATVYWPNTVAGETHSYYCSSGPTITCPRGEGIYVLSDPPADPYYDADEYNDDVLWRQYGYFIANHFSKDDSPGGAHIYYFNDYDLRLTWSEGWVEFFQAAVKVWLYNTNAALLSFDPSATPLSQYVNAATATIPGASYFSLTLGAPETASNPSFYCKPGECQYASNEIAVANVLWTLMEGNGLNGGYGMGPIWTAVTDTTFTATTPRVNMESFFDTLTSAASSTTIADIRAVFSSRSIDYSPDGYEPADDNFGIANLYTSGITTQSHTLFSDVSSTHYDEDYVAINVTNPGLDFTVYSVTTSNLLNGAAPVIEILEPGDHAVIASSDPSTSFVPFCDASGCHVNGTSTLASEPSFTFTSPVGTAFVRIRSSDNRPPSAGRYGSYTVTIASPP